MDKVILRSHGIAKFIDKSIWGHYPVRMLAINQYTDETSTQNAFIDYRNHLELSLYENFFNKLTDCAMNNCQLHRFTENVNLSHS